MNPFVELTFSTIYDASHEKTTVFINVTKVMMIRKVRGTNFYIDIIFENELAERCEFKEKDEWEMAYSMIISAVAHKGERGE